MPAREFYPALWVEPVFCGDCGRLLASRREDSETWFKDNPDAHSGTCQTAAVLRAEQTREVPAEE